VSHKQLILPQLAAGGVSIPEMPKSFPFNIKFGPVWSKDLKQYLAQHPVKKPDSMKLAQFSLDQRNIAGFTHLTFLLRKFAFWPSVVIFFLLWVINLRFESAFTALVLMRGLEFLGFVWLGLIFTCMCIAWFFPFSDRYKFFLQKGLIFAFCFVPFLAILAWVLFQNWLYLGSSLIFNIWLIIFCTMSFSGYTMASSPRDIQGEYPRFQTIHRTLLSISIILYALVFYMEVRVL